MSKIDAKVKNKLKSVKSEWIILLETSADDMSEVGISSLKTMLGKGKKGIVISTSKPCKNVLDVYEENGVDTKKIFIIDTICKTQTSKPPEIDNVLHVESSSSLTDISISLNEVMNSLKGDSFAFLDSVTSMLIHNKPKTFSKFIHSILTKMRMKGVGGILLSLEKETPKDVRAEIAQLCDKIIKV